VVVARTSERECEDTRACEGSREHPEHLPRFGSSRKKLVSKRRKMQ
jgi:hypothetical protein